MGGGTIIFQEATTQVTDYLVGASTNNVTGGTLQFGDASSAAGQLYFINGSTPVFNLTLTTTNSPNLRLVTTAITVKGDLTVQTAATLDAATNNLNMTVAGNWSNSGTFSAGTNTVTL
jgi:hypothetical protein